MPRQFRFLAFFCLSCLSISSIADGTLPFLFGDGTLPFHMTGKVEGNVIEADFFFQNHQSNQPQEPEFRNHTCPLNLDFYSFQRHKLEGLITYNNQYYRVIGICYDSQNFNRPGKKIREIVATRFGKDIRLSGTVSSQPNRELFVGKFGKHKQFTFSYSTP